MLGHVVLGLTNHREFTQTYLETFHPFTHILILNPEELRLGDGSRGSRINLTSRKLG
jgi:hypothetical protein